jgi:rhodanese-related sulfurtransferase
VFAVGDAIQVRSVVTGADMGLALAGPANRQGRIAADTIAGRSASFRGVQGTSVLGGFGLSMAMTGASEKVLAAAGIPFEKVRLHPGNHVGYYPGASTIHLKVLFDPETGTVLGGSAVGSDGIDKRIDVIAMAVQMQAGVEDLAEAELCYAPQFGSAKDPVNMAGMIAMNHLSGLSPLTHIEDLDSERDCIIDVRPTLGSTDITLPAARHIPLPRLRDELPTLPSNRPIKVLCKVGQTAHNAVRLLRQHGRYARLISGGATSLGQLR